MEMRRKFRVVVNGREYVVEVEEIGGEGEIRSVERVQPVSPKQSAPAPAPAPTAMERDSVQNVSGGVTAPMPGKIIEIRVKVGDAVKRGQVIAILEAMKMENEIPAPKDGVVREIRVSEGDNVNRGDVLVVIE